MQQWAMLRRASPPTTLFCFFKHPVARLHAAHLAREGRIRTYTRDPTTMSTTVEIATVPTADTPGTCILVHHDMRSYVFGQIPEGTQRAFASRKLRLSHTRHIFLSGPVGWSQMGGLAGFLLSAGSYMEEQEKEATLRNTWRCERGKAPLYIREEPFTLHAADNLAHMLATIRPVIFRQSIPIKISEHRTDPRRAAPADDPAAQIAPDFEDESVRVWKIPIQRCRSSSPPKRRCSDAEIDLAAVYKDATETSDPFVATMIAENIMFNGSQENSSLVPKKVEDLTPDDKAIVVQGNCIRRYTGPYGAQAASQQSADQVKPWVFPVRSTPRVQGDDCVLAINDCDIPPALYSQTSMSYIFKCRDRRGKFDNVTAKELGVHKLDNKRLIQGQSITLEGGKVVTPDMVLGDPIPGKGIAIADISGRDFVDSFFERPEWYNEELMANIITMYWILGYGLESDAKIQHYIKSNPQIKHVLCSQNTCPNMVTNKSAADMLSRLRRVDPDRFHVVKFDNTVKYQHRPDVKVELGRAGDKTQLMPRLVHYDDNIAPFPDLRIAYHSVDKHTMDLVHTAAKKTKDAAFCALIERQEADIPNRDAEIMPLGTGSSAPSKHRNVCSTLICVPGIGNYLLDCGEGTLGQIRRLYDDRGTAMALRHLRCIVISHIHADHLLGLVSVIKAWYSQALADDSDAMLAIVCLSRIRSVLKEISQAEDIGFHRLRFPFSPQDRPTMGKRDVVTSEEMATLGAADSFGLRGIKRFSVQHCWMSFATELELTSGLRIAWSGDCRPSERFALGCRGAHLLVHECTFDDEMEADARAKMHCTMSEALLVAKTMGARRTLLTHFSQRYVKQRVPRSRYDGIESYASDEDQERAGSILLAHDLMRVRLGDFQKAACFGPAIFQMMARAAAREAKEKEHGVGVLKGKS